MLEAEVFLKEHNFVDSLDPFYAPNLGKIDYSKPIKATFFEREVGSLSLRRKYIPIFGFAIPNEEAIKAIAKLSPLLEIGAGSGYWAYELRKLGTDIIAAEPRLTKYSFWRETGNQSGHWEEKAFTQLENITGQKIVKQYRDRNLFFCWPDYKAKWPAATLKKSHCEYVAYVGEIGGCTADAKFQEILETEFEEVEFVQLPHFFGIHDNLMIYKRKKK